MEIVLCNVLTLSTMALLLGIVLVGPVGSVQQEHKQMDFRQYICAIVTGFTGCTEISPHPTLEDALGLCSGKSPTTKTGKCLLECNWRYNNITTDNGFQTEFYVDVVKRDHKIKDAASVTALEEIINECKVKKDPNNDKCETAVIIADCLHNEGRKLNISSLGYEAFYIAPLY